MGLDYEIHPINITKDEQFDPEFLKISPNNKIPALVDGSQTVFESAACLIYLAEKTGRFLPSRGPERVVVLEWLMFQMGGFGPILGQAHHFLKFNPGVSTYAEDRFSAEARRLYSVLDGQLAKDRYVAGPDLSIADFAIWPWASRFEWQQIDMAAYPHVTRWYEELAARDGFIAGYDVPRSGQKIPHP